MKRKCSLEEKLEAIALVEQGMSARSVSDKLHLGHHILFILSIDLYSHFAICPTTQDGMTKRYDEVLVFP